MGLSESLQVRPTDALDTALDDRAPRMPGLVNMTLGSVRGLREEEGSMPVHKRVWSDRAAARLAGDYWIYDTFRPSMASLSPIIDGYIVDRGYTMRIPVYLDYGDVVANWS
jgi:hypothetical protein